MEKIRYLSLFSGIEAFSQAVEDLNFEPVGFAEIEPFACEVLKTRYPDVKNYGDVSKIDGTALKGKVDLIVGGSPCQDFSQAGGRLGLEGERSSLAIEYIRLLNEIQPYAFIWENVPGCTSTNSGNDLRMLLETFQDAGYVLDADILDSQFFGIPQRRRRIFVCGISLEYILKRKTSSSLLITTKSLLEILHSILDAALTLSGKELERSALQDLLGAGVKRKMTLLFKLGSPKEQWQALQEQLDAGSRKLASELKSLGALRGKIVKGELPDALLTALWTESQSILTEESLKRSSEDLFLLRKLYTTSMATSETIRETIFVCSRIAMHISWLITLTRICSPSLSIVDISDLTPIQEFTKYARRTSSSLLGDFGRADYWADFIRQARLQEEAFRDIGADRERARSILFEFQGMPGHSSEGGEAGEGDSGRIEGDVGVGGERIAQNPTFATLCASGAGCDRPSAQGSQLDYLVIDCTAMREPRFYDNISPSILKTLDHQQRIAVVRRNARCWPISLQNAIHKTDDPAGGCGIGDEGGPAFTMRADGKPPAVGIANKPKYVVRRITPVEAERLMGMRDGWTDIEWKGKPAPDTARYRCLGNSMVTVVMRFIALRIADVLADN